MFILRLSANSNTKSLLSLLTLILTFVSPFVPIKWDNFPKLSEFDISRTILEKDLFENSFKLINFLTFILLNLFSSLPLSRRTVINNELPSIKIFLLCSKISENINSSKIPPKSVSLILAYEVPF